jgi:hypothetical protein
MKINEIFNKAISCGLPKGVSPVYITCVTVATRASRDFLGGRQNFLPCSWQHRFGKQSIGVLQGLGKRSKRSGGGGVHCR